MAAVKSRLFIFQRVARSPALMVYPPRPQEQSSTNKNGEFARGETRKKGGNLIARLFNLCRGRRREEIFVSCSERAVGVI